MRAAGCSRSQVSSEWGESVSESYTPRRRAAAHRTYAIDGRCGRRDPCAAVDGRGAGRARGSRRSGAARRPRGHMRLSTTYPSGAGSWPVPWADAGVVSWPPALQTCVRPQPPHGRGWCAPGRLLELHAASACTRQGSRFCSPDDRGTSNNAVTGFRKRNAAVCTRVLGSRKWLVASSNSRFFRDSQWPAT
jgi:hypothetical protein